MIEARLREFYKEHVNDARLKMSEVPEGAELIVDGRLGFPTIKCENFYILPGIPEIFEQKFETLRERFDADALHAARRLHARGRGHDRRASERHPGGVPASCCSARIRRSAHPEYAVKLTLESKDPDYVERALAHLLQLLPAEAVVRTE